MQCGAAVVCGLGVVLGPGLGMALGLPFPAYLYRQIELRMYTLRLRWSCSTCANNSEVWGVNEDADHAHLLLPTVLYSRRGRLSSTMNLRPTQPKSTSRAGEGGVGGGGSDAAALASPPPNRTHLGQCVQPELASEAQTL